jgi:hypothetical protein
MGFVALSGCGGGMGTADLKSNQIAPGMSSAQVESILGVPQDRQFNGRKEAWQYCQRAFDISAIDKYLLIWIDDGMVSAMQSYSQPRRGVSCASPLFQTVNWRSGPAIR